MKKTFSTLAVILTLLLSTKAQPTASWCGSVLTDEYKAYYEQVDRNSPEYLRNAQGSRAIRWIPVAYHVITKTDGTEGIKIRDIFDTHCELNQTFNPFNLGFYIVAIDTIKNTTLWNYQNQSLGYQAFSQYNRANTCNIYVNGNLPGLCGFATFPGTGSNGGGVFLNRSCVGAGTKTLPHEMGHYLGLLHTFEDAYGVEVINRNGNCSTAGDRFCDTPADFIGSRTACPYNGTETDANGDFYRDVIDETLLMSYFNDDCVNRFSNQQQAAMNNVVSTSRANLLSQNLPDLSDLDTATVISPLRGDTTVPSNYAVIKWRAVPRAAYYLFYLQSSTSVVVYSDTIVRDTSIIVTNLLPNKTYKYRVKAISLANPCSPYTTYATFKTSTIKATVSQITRTCAGENNGSAAITITNGFAPYSILWNNGDTDSLLNDVAGGVYTATISDLSGEVSNVTVTIPEYTPINITFTQTGNNATAVASGGRSPFTYNWSNGSTTAANTDLAFGTYTVTVTDANGCQSTAQLIISGVNDLQQQPGIKVYPNPSNKQDLHVDLSLTKSDNVIIELITTDGRLMLTNQWYFNAGNHELTFNTGNLPAGVYNMVIRGAGFVQVKRVTLL